MKNQQVNFGTAQTDRKADIVFCVDATFSMDPCFLGVKNNIREFIDGLNTQGEVDWRFKLLAYRDKHSNPETLWQEFEFTNSAEVFKKNLDSVTPIGGNDLPESTLDALYISIKSKWRTDAELQRVIVLLTDADSHPLLHPTTYNFPDNNIDRVVQEFQTLKHSMLFMIAPDFPIYKKLDEAMTKANKKIFFKPLPINETKTDIEDKYRGLNNVNFKIMLKIISESISSSF